MAEAWGERLGAGIEPALETGLAAAAASARAEWRADEEHWANAALEQWRHARTLTDVAREHLHRGDTISMCWPGATSGVTGRVLGVGADSLAVETAAGRVDTRLTTSIAIAWRVVERAPRGGRRGLVLDTFRARLLELEVDGRPVDVAMVGDDMVRGEVRVASDHVLVDAPESEWVVALSAICWVRALVD